MSSRSVRIITVTSITVLVAVIVAASARPALVTYHRWRLERAWWKAHWEGEVIVTPEGLIGFDVTDAVPVYEYHLRKLVWLGHLFYKEYEFDKVPVEAHSSLLREIRAAFPDSRHVTLSHPDSTLCVWDVWDRYQKWNTFFLENNVEGKYSVREAFCSSGRGDASWDDEKEEDGED